MARTGPNREQSTERRPPLDIKAAAAYCGLTERWLRAAVLERRVPFVRLGRFIRFEPDLLDEWLAASRVEPLPDPLVQLRRPELKPAQGGGRPRKRGAA